MTSDISSFTIPSGFLNLRNKRVAFSKEGIEIEKKGKIFIPWTDVEHIKYGAEWVTGIFTTGLRFDMAFLAKNNKEYKISFISLYGKGMAKHSEIFKDMVRVLWDDFLLAYYKNLVDTFEKSGIELCGLTIGHESIRFKKFEIPWDVTECLTLRGYFTLKDKTDAKKEQQFHFRKDWDAVLLYPFMKNMIEHYGETHSVNN